LPHILLCLAPPVPWQARRGITEALQGKNKKQLESDLDKPKPWILW